MKRPDAFGGPRQRPAGATLPEPQRGEDDHRHGQEDNEEGAGYADPFARCPNGSKLRPAFRADDAPAELVGAHAAVGQTRRTERVGHRMSHQKSENADGEDEAGSSHSSPTGNTGPVPCL